METSEIITQKQLLNRARRYRRRVNATFHAYKGDHKSSGLPYIVYAVDALNWDEDTPAIDIRVDEGEKDTICFVLRRGDIVRYFKLSVDWGGDKLWYLFWGKKRGQWVSLTRDYDFIQGFKSVMRYAGKFNTTC